MRRRTPTNTAREDLVLHNSCATSVSHPGPRPKTRHCHSRAPEILVCSHGSRTLNSWPRESWLWHQVIADERHLDRKSTRLNSSHGYISYAVFCLKKKNPEHLRAARVLDARRHRDPDLAPARQVLRHPDP